MLNILPQSRFLSQYFSMILYAFSGKYKICTLIQNCPFFSKVLTKYSQIISLLIIIFSSEWVLPYNLYMNSSLIRISRVFKEICIWRRQTSQLMMDRKSTEMIENPIITTWIPMLITIKYIFKILYSCIHKYQILCSLKHE